MIQRRRFLIAAASALPVLSAGPSALARPGFGTALGRALPKIEADSGGRLGVALYEPSSGRSFDWRGTERFPMCSTFKALLAGATLARVDEGQEQLDRLIPVKRSDILAHSPTTEKHVGGAASVAALCEATVIWSDNAAANLLLVGVGGPEGFTRYLRGLGDTVTRLDRIEPSMSEATPGDPRDTTSPTAMLKSLDRLLLGRALSPGSRTRLTNWMIENRTGDKRLRAGLPKGWRVGDKTGSGPYGTVNDVAILWPPGRPPMLVASYLTGSRLEAAGRDAVHAEVARAVAAAIG